MVIVAAQAGSPSDAQALRAAVTRPEEFRVVYDRHVPVVRRYLLAQVNADLADDLTAETFTVALRRCAAYVPRSDSARSWLLGIAANLVRGSHRSHARRARAFMRLPRARDVGLDRGLERIEVTDEARTLWVALAAISAVEREVLLLSAVGELSYDEIALALGIPIGTVRSRLHRARTSMRAALTVKEESA